MHKRVAESETLESEHTQAEELHRTLASSSPASAFIAQKEKIVFVNPQCYKLMGYGEDELLGEDPLALVHPEDRELVRKSVVAMLKGEHSSPYEFRVINKRRETVWCVGTVSPINYKGTRATLGNFMDITKHKRVDEERRVYAAGIDSANESIVFTKMNGDVLYFNKSACRIFGYTPAEMKEINISKFSATSADGEKLEGSLREKGEFLGEIMGMRKNGERFPSTLSVSIVNDDKGNPIGRMGVFSDITERKRVEEVLRESEDRLSSFMNSATDVFALFDSELNLLQANKYALDAWGFSEEEVIGKNILDLSPNLKETGRYDNYMDVIRRGRPIYMDDVVPHPKFGDRHLTVKAFKSGDGLGLIATDITERKQTEQKLIDKTREVERANQLKSEFLAKMSHELRTPLNVIIGFSELMMDEVPGKINDEQRHCLSDVLDSGQHLLSLINEVLDLSKIESGKVELKLNNIVLTKVIALVTRIMMPILTPRKQSLDTEVEKGLPPVRADKDKLEQVLLNLVDNSSKFTPHGGKLKIEAVREGDWCRVSVIDTGIGIKIEDQERIFEPFCQLDNSLTKEKSDTGLGLSVSKQIIERHSGQIWVESEYGKGSRFTFTLPLATTH
jgi:PAS domain S-box-containing protein